MTRLRDAERDLDRLRSAQLLGAAEGLARDAEDVGGVAFVAHRVPDGTAADGIRKLALDIRGRLPAQRPVVVMVAGLPADRPTVVITVNEAARARSAWRLVPWSGPRRASWAEAVAAGMTSPRVAERRSATIQRERLTMLLVRFGRL